MTEKPYAEFGKRLRKLREKKGETQKKVSIKLKIGRTTIGEHERGIRLPKQAFFDKYVEYYRVEPQCLHYGSTDPGRKGNESTPSEDMPPPPSDVKDRGGLYGKTERLKQNGVTVSVSTHDPKVVGHPLSPTSAKKALMSILESENTDLINAILFNLKALEVAVGSKKENNQRIDELIDENKKLKERIGNLEDTVQGLLDQLGAQKKTNSATTNV